MSLSLGSTTIGSLYLGSTKVGEVYLGSTKMYGSAAPGDPDNPLNLPPYTIRVKFSDGHTPTYGDSRTQVSESPNVWDITKNSTSWNGLLGSYDYSVLEVLGANSAGVTDMSQMFYGFHNLTGVTQLNTKDVTDMSSMFSSCDQLTSIPALDTRSATKMSYMFSGTGITSVSLPNTGSATNMSRMFYSCRNLTSVSLSDTSSATDMQEMFRSCNKLTSVTLPDTSSVTNMREMFYGCSAITSVTLPKTGSVTTMDSMFRDCTNLTSVSLPDTSSVTDMPYMFSNCTNLTSVSLPDTSSVKNMTQMFNGCTSLTTAPSLNTSSAQGMGYMFVGCTSLTTAPQLDTSNATAMNGMFSECTSLTSVPLYSTSSAENVSYMFNGCTAVESGSLALYQQMSTQAVPPTDYSNCFTNCGANTASGLAELNQIPYEWGGNYDVRTHMSATSSDSYLDEGYYRYAYLCGATSPDWSTSPQLDVVTSGIYFNFAASNICCIHNGGGDFSTLSYARPAFVQFDSNTTSPGVTWVLTTSSPLATYTGSGVDISKAMQSSSAYGLTNKVFGTYDSSKSVYFVYLITIKDPSTWTISDAYGYLRTSLSDNLMFRWLEGNS